MRIVPVLCDVDGEHLSAGPGLWQVVDVDAVSIAQGLGELGTAISGHAIRPLEEQRVHEDRNAEPEQECRERGEGFPEQRWLLPHVVPRAAVLRINHPVGIQVRIPGAVLPY